MTYDAEAAARTVEQAMSACRTAAAARAVLVHALRSTHERAHAAGEREGAESMRERAAAHLDRRAGDASLLMSPQQTRREAASEIRALPLDDGGDQ